MLVHLTCKNSNSRPPTCAVPPAMSVRPSTTLPAPCNWERAGHRAAGATAQDASQPETAGSHDRRLMPNPASSTSAPGPLWQPRRPPQAPPRARCCPRRWPQLWRHQLPPGRRQPPPRQPPLPSCWPQRQQRGPALPQPRPRCRPGRRAGRRGARACPAKMGCAGAPWLPDASWLGTEAVYIPDSGLATRCAASRAQCFPTSPPAGPRPTRRPPASPPPSGPAPAGLVQVREGHDDLKDLAGQGSKERVRTHTGCHALAPPRPHPPMLHH